MELTSSRRRIGPYYDADFAATHGHGSAILGAREAATGRPNVAGHGGFSVIKFRDRRLAGTQRRLTLRDLGADHVVSIGRDGDRGQDADDRDDDHELDKGKTALLSFHVNPLFNPR